MQEINDNKLYVYLDYNVFAEALNVPDVLNLLMVLNKSECFIFPFTQIHISEVNGIKDVEKRQAQLEIIKKISNSNYLDFRAGIGKFTVRPRDPFEVFDTINEVPIEIIKDVQRAATELFLEKIEGFPKDCYQPNEQYKYFVTSFREYFPNAGQIINNLSRNDALDWLDENLFKDMKIESLYSHITSTQPELDQSIFTLEFFKDNMLYISGYKTPMKDVVKASGLLLDHQHITYTRDLLIIISKDKNFRKKLQSKDSKNEKVILDMNEGLTYLFILSKRMLSKYN